VSELVIGQRKQPQGVVAVGARKMDRLLKISNPLVPALGSAFIIRQTALQNSLPQATYN
jgi:hypothetical protein